jgi:hypothetical protein
MKEVKYLMQLQNDDNQRANWRFLRLDRLSPRLLSPREILHLLLPSLPLRPA